MAEKLARKSFLVALDVIEDSKRAAHLAVKSTQSMLRKASEFQDENSSSDLDSDDEAEECARMEEDLEHVSLQSINIFFACMKSTEMEQEFCRQRTNAARNHMF